jgi:hypothetical protein
MRRLFLLEIPNFKAQLTRIKVTKLYSLLSKDFMQVGITTSGRTQKIIQSINTTDSTQQIKEDVL